MSNTHGLKALNILNAVFTTSELDDRTEAITNMLGAQVHATLAVAEQLRIANLIALATSGVEDGRGGLHAFKDDSFGRFYESALRPDIAASLGLAVEE